MTAYDALHGLSQTWLEVRCGNINWCFKPKHRQPSGTERRMNAYIDSGVSNGRVESAR